MAPKVEPPKITHRVFLDVEIKGHSSETHRIELGLFGELFPKTVENFRALITGEKGIGPVSGKPLHYKGSVIHRIVPNFMIQGGDFTHGTGVGGESIYGTRFDDENMEEALQMDKPMYLAMANWGPNTNGSQFFITTVKTRWLDGKNVVFGKVIGGKDSVKAVEQLGTMSGKPKRKVTIVDCGEL